MNILLDTHTLIWYLEGNKSLSVRAKNTIESVGNSIYISIASLWEMSIKAQLGKLKLIISFSELSEILLKYHINILPITIDDIIQNSYLEFFHRDPFDRIIISQALKNDFRIITNDKIFEKYQVAILW